MGLRIDPPEGQLLHPGQKAQHAAAQQEKGGGGHQGHVDGGGAAEGQGGVLRYFASPEEKQGGQSQSYSRNQAEGQATSQSSGFDEAPAGFSAIDEDIPF